MLSTRRTLVIIGNDPSFTIDLSAFRGVREQTGMTFSRLKNPTEAELQKHLIRLRTSSDGELPNIHISAHMGPKGIQLQDNLISPERVSELFSGAPNMFLAGCESVEIGDALSSVGNVLSIIEKIDNDQAVAFSLIFWAAIALGRNAQDAFDEAAERFPTTAEFAYLHTNDFLSMIGKT